MYGVTSNDVCIEKAVNSSSDYVNDGVLLKISENDATKSGNVRSGAYIDSSNSSYISETTFNSVNESGELKKRRREYYRRVTHVQG